MWRPECPAAPRQLGLSESPGGPPPGVALHALHAGAVQPGRRGVRGARLPDAAALGRSVRAAARRGRRPRRRVAGRTRCVRKGAVGGGPAQRIHGAAAARGRRAVAFER
eukprot:111314-Chlamydomonas_euryale.AAC.1